MHELCWKCKEILVKNGWPEIGLGLIPYLHCHHEPKEKPKPKCEVCGYGAFRVIIDNQSEREHYRPNRPIGVLIKFCPECGRDLR